MTEAELLRAASGLGERAVRKLDEQRVARTVLARLATEPVAPARTLRPRPLWVLGLAAAATILLVLRPGLPGSKSPAEPAGLAAPALTVLHELDDLTASELETVLETLPPAASATAHPETPSLDELDAKSLEQLLRSLEG